MRIRVVLAIAGLAAMAAGPATAQGHHHGAHGGHSSQGGAAVDTPATREFKAAHARMMRNMGLPYTGDPDVDFRTHMIPHHQGAIEMAKAALKHAKNDDTKKMAQKIIDDQEKEIAEMQAWLKQCGK